MKSKYVCSLYRIAFKILKNGKFIQIRVYVLLRKHIFLMMSLIYLWNVYDENFIELFLLLFFFFNISTFYQALFDMNIYTIFNFAPYEIEYRIFRSFTESMPKSNGTLNKNVRTTNKKETNRNRKITISSGVSEFVMICMQHEVLVMKLVLLPYETWSAYDLHNNGHIL